MNKYYKRQIRLGNLPGNNGAGESNILNTRLFYRMHPKMPERTFKSFKGSIMDILNQDYK